MRHITFANSYYEVAAKKLQRSAEEYGLESKIYRPSDIEADFVKQHEEHFRCSRGYGYWVWKPWIIAKELSKMNPGELLVYTDAGCRFTSNPIALLELASEREVILFELTQHLEKCWTKPEVFKALSVPSHHQDSPQILSSFLVLKKTPFTETFIQEWLSLVSDFKLVNDTTSSKDSFFVAHRHDQSLLSIIAKRHAISAHRDPSQFGNSFLHLYSNSTYEQLIQHTREAKLPFLLRFQKSVQPKIQFIIRKCVGSFSK